MKHQLLKEHYIYKDLCVLNVVIRNGILTLERYLNY